MSCESAESTAEANDNVRFNLLDEDWVPVVRRADGAWELVGLLEVFERSGEFRWLVGESPIVTAALHRLLQAIAHRALDGPRGRTDWKRLWTEPSLLSGKVLDYLSSQRDRFWLVHPTHPFLQCPALSAKDPLTPAKLVLNRAAGNNVTLFDHTTATDRPRIAAGEAARWLVTIHAFDTGGNKTPYRADKSSVPALCNRFGVTLVEGDTLRSTLLLNLVPYAPGRGIPASTSREDGPVWEASEPPDPEPYKNGHRPPRGWVDLLTWPSRRILLHTTSGTNGIDVDGVVIAPGDRLHGELAALEQQAAFRRELKRDKKTGRRYPVGEAHPVRLEQLKGVWRYAAELLLAPQSELGRQRPGVMDHVASVAPEETYTLRVIGQQLMANPGAVESWLEETLPAPVALLRLEPGHPLEPLLGHAVELADEIGAALEGLDNGYDKELDAEHKRSPGKKPKHSMLSQWYWPRLDEPFRALLHELGGLLRDAGPEDRTVHGAVIDQFHRWRESCEAVARESVETWAERSPRHVERQVLALGKHQELFRYRLRRVRTAYEVNIESFRRHDEEDGDG